MTDFSSERAGYLPLEMSERFEFQFFERGVWMGEAQCLARDFTRNEDGSYVGSAGGSPIWFRCVEKRDDGFIHVDGTGRRFIYRLLPLPVPPEVGE